MAAPHAVVPSAPHDGRTRVSVCTHNTSRLYGQSGVIIINLQQAELRLGLVGLGFVLIVE